MNAPFAPKLDAETYLAHAATWADDVQGSLRSSRRTAWIVAGVASGVAAMQAIALVALLPLKTVVPYTITVDRQSGYVETAQGLKPGGILTQDQAVTQSFLVQYVLARESFDAADLKVNYRKVQLWSAPPARDRYLADMAPANPASPLKLYPATTVVAARIKSVALLSPTSAMVRFDSERRDAGAVGATIRPMSAVIGFKYSGAPMRMEDRFVNPLGFQVTSYRVDSEAAAPPLAPTPSAAPPPAVTPNIPNPALAAPAKPEVEL